MVYLFINVVSFAELTFLDLTTNRCHEGFPITLSCESDVNGRVDIFSPDGNPVTRACNFIDGLDSERYSIEDCSEVRRIKLVIRTSSQDFDEGDWTCRYDGSNPTATLFVLAS